MKSPRWQLKPDLLALVRRIQARPTRQAQRAMYRVRVLARAEDRLRDAALKGAPQPPGDNCREETQTSQRTAES